MNEKVKIMISDFIKSEFPIKRVKNEKNKWSRAIIIPQGYVSKDKKIYKLNKTTNINHELIASDIIKTVINFFSYNQRDCKELVIKYVNSILI
jgi:6-phosphofructokinase